MSSEVPRLTSMAKPAVVRLPESYFYKNDGSMDTEKAKRYVLSILPFEETDRGFFNIASQKVGKIVLDYLSLHPEALDEEEFSKFYDTLKGHIRLPDQPVSPRLVNLLSKHLPDHCFKIPRVDDSEEIFENVRHIILDPNTTDDELKQIIKKFPSLRSIDLTKCKRITKAGIDTLRDSKLPLKKIALSLHVKVREGVVTTFLASSDEEIQLSPKIFVSHIKADPNLTEIDLGLLVQKFPELQSLSLRKCGIGNKGLEHLSKLRSLKKLDLFEAGVTKDGLKILRNLPLTNLIISDIRFTEDDISLLPPTLEKLGFFDCVFIDKSLSNLPASLRDLAFLRATILESSEPHLERLPHLKKLTVHFSRSSLEEDVLDLTFIEGLSNLEELDLSLGWNLRNENLRHLTPLRSLTTLNLFSCDHLTEEGLNVLPASLRLLYWKDPNSRSLNALRSAREGLVITWPPEDEDEE